MFIKPTLPHSETLPSVPDRTRQTPVEEISGTNTIDPSQLKNGGGRIKSRKGFVIEGPKKFQNPVTQSNEGSATFQKSRAPTPKPTI